MLGDHVTDSSRWADGAGDLYVSFGGESGPAYGAFIEIKSSEKAALTAMQIRFRKAHQGVHFRCESVEQARLLCGYIRRQVEILAGARAGESWSRIRALVSAQADDAALWFEAVTAPEAYLQAALRKLHAAVEGD